MSTYYFDTSALSKRYVTETGTLWVRALMAPASGHALLTSRVSMVEFFSALARRRREGSVPAADCATAEQAFSAHSAAEYDFVEFDLIVAAEARSLLERHPLRAYDVIQLASAMLADRTLRAARLPGLVFVSADDRLNDAATLEGLSVDNPNRHT